MDDDQERDWWLDFGQHLGWELVGFRGRVIATFRRKNGSIIAIPADAKMDIEAAMLRQKARAADMREALYHCWSYLFDDSGTPIAPEELRKRVRDLIQQDG